MSPAQPLDGVRKPSASAKAQTPPAVKRWKGLLIVTLGGITVVYAIWSFILLSLLPSSDPALRSLNAIGLLIALVVGVGFLAIGALMTQRIAVSPTTPRARLIALAKVALAVGPAVILSVLTPLMTLRTVPISIAITSPGPEEQLVAPVAMTFSVEHALENLKASGFVPVQYRWDIDNDRVTDQETSVPELVATFEREGTYTITVQMVSASNSTQSATRRFVIQRSVFKTTPAEPIKDQPTIFSLAHLYEQQGVVAQVQWDFNNDGTADETTTSLEATHTFFQTGNAIVRVVVSLTNNTQATYERRLTIIDPPALPFPVSLITEPKNLIGAPPFPVLFRIETAESVARVEWNFGDGEQSEGTRVAHTFAKKGSFPVSVSVQTQSGVVARLQTAVNVVDELRLSDLTFEGTPEVRSGKIEGEVPLTLNLTPKTATPFVSFQWEAPEATDVGSTETTLEAIYRREGTFTVTLIAQDLEDHVMRMPITVTVKPAESSLSIAMDPETGLAPLSVKFDASESFIPGESITGFVWNYGDGSEEQFGGARAEHVYTKAGTYSIGLSVRTTSGKSYTTRKTLVVRESLLRACITPSRIRGTAPLGVDFSSACTVGAPTSYLWDFGDGSQSDLKNIIHVFEEPGTYSVTLTVREGEATHTATVTITAQP